MYLNDKKDFLILIQPPGFEGCSKPIKALVRKVALRQCGHWMMGTARIYGESVSMSGSYGADGLIRSVSQAVYDRATVRLPGPLREMWDTGGGWNTAGSEAPSMRRWALDNLDELRK